MATSTLTTGLTSWWTVGQGEGRAGHGGWPRELATGANQVSCLAASSSSWSASSSACCPPSSSTSPWPQAPSSGWYVQTAATAVLGSRLPAAGVEWAGLLHRALCQGPPLASDSGLAFALGTGGVGTPSHACQDVSVGLGGRREESSPRLVVWEGFLEEGSSELGQEGRTGGRGPEELGLCWQGLAQACTSAQV